MKRRNFLQMTTLLPALAAGLNLGSALDAAGHPGLEVEDEPRDFFYRPLNAMCGDVIPFYENGIFHLFFLPGWRDRKKHDGTWYRISTKDFVNFTEHGETIPIGTREDQDLNIITGCVIKAEGQYHMFYTGHNQFYPKAGKAEQAIMHAISRDLIKWEKLPADNLYAPDDQYDKNNWRDPFVFWNAPDKEYNMLVAARHIKGVSRRSGLSAICTSKNLKDWKVKGPFYAPDLYFIHECPDLFNMGDWWYLVFSENSDLFSTRYRMSRSRSGPWLSPANDQIDGHGFYAAKSASDGKRRYIFGWNGTREGAADKGRWQWGGNLIVHELQQQKDGTLTVRAPETVAKAFSKAVPFEFLSGKTLSQQQNGEVKVNAKDTFAAVLAGKMPGKCKISMKVRFDDDTTECGIMIKTSEDQEKTYYIRLEPKNHRLVFDSWPRPTIEVPHFAEWERKIQLLPGKTMQLQVYIDGDVGVAYANDQVAMSFRAYSPEDNWGIFATGGKVSFQDISIYTI